jgi:hypothetical protein
MNALKALAPYAFVLGCEDRTDVGTIAACIDRMHCDFVKCRSPAASTKPPPQRL